MATSSVEKMVTGVDAVWIATALLHRAYPDREDFTVKEIRDRLYEEPLFRSMHPGTIETHIRLHCVANLERNPNRVRLLFATGTRTRRLFRPGDPYDPTREAGKTVPRLEALPPQYADLLHWYFQEYAPPAERDGQPDPILALRGIGREIWADEHPDAYVSRLREGWE